jgi:pimeloyl-ACP methyl ester carboxylesterase
LAARRHSFRHEGFRLVYDEYGSGPRPLVLLPGLLLSRKMHAPLAQALADRGSHVYVLDFLGHGDSDRPRDLARYSMPLLGDQVVGLLDHLELDEAVVGGTSLGANVLLDVMARAPERLRGAIIEMPVLDNALLGCALAFTPLMVYLTFGSPLARLVARGARIIPRGSHNLVDAGLDWVSQDPGPSGAVLQGLFFGRIAPPRSERALIETRSLVIGHPRDPVHPFSDADELARELRNARLVDANSILELRLAPERLTNEIARFVDECWRPTAAERRRGAGRSSARSGRRRASA